MIPKTSQLLFIEMYLASQFAWAVLVNIYLAVAKRLSHMAKLEKRKVEKILHRLDVVAFLLACILALFFNVGILFLMTKT